MHYRFRQESFVVKHLVGEILYAAKNGCGLGAGYFDFPFAYHLAKSCHLADSDLDPTSADEDFVNFFFGLCDMFADDVGDVT